MHQAFRPIATVNQPSITRHEVPFTVLLTEVPSALEEQSITIQAHASTLTQPISNPSLVNLASITVLKCLFICCMRVIVVRVLTTDQRIRCVRRRSIGVVVHPTTG